MPAPRWARWLLRIAAPREQIQDVLGDLEESYSNPVETLDIAAALIRARVSALRMNHGSHSLHDYKLGLRMLVKFPGLTIAGGLALAIAIGLGAGWFEFSSNLFRPRLPIPGGDRVVEIEMRNAAASEDERRIMHDFVGWRDHAKLLTDLGAYRTLERPLAIGGANAEPVTVAETTASLFRAAAVPPALGRPLLDSDERPGAAPVVVVGYTVWQRQFDARPDVIGQTVRLGQTTTTIVGVMPEGFAFPINHRLWIPFVLTPAGYGPLEGPAVRVFGRLAAGATQAQAYAEVTALTERTAAASPATHQYLRPRVLAYGGESPGDRRFLEIALTHLPIFFVLVVACVNVGTLIYARTATRDAEIALRYALGASRGRIVMQLFVEAWVLASVSAVVGLWMAHLALKWGFATLYAGQIAPFWIDPGLSLRTVLYATTLTTVGAALLGVLPALKATRSQVQGQLKTIGAGGSTLRFGKMWTAAMVVQVALTVICIPPAVGIAGEAWRDRVIRARFPTHRYLAVRIAVDANGDAVYRELARRVAAEPGVEAVTFADRLPGMGPKVRHAEVERASGVSPVEIPNIWTTDAGPGFFEAFGAPLVSGRAFHDGDRATGARTVLVNEAFARQYLNGANPVGARVRYAGSAQPAAEPWLEIVGMVRDIGMTPTDRGEAPYIFHAAAATASPFVVGIKTAGEAAALAPRVRALALAVDPDLRVDDLRTLREHVSRVDLPQTIVAFALGAIVALGLFLSAAGIFALMSVSVARRTREIGLRAALGASPARLLAGVFTRALALVGGGVFAGNLVLLTVVGLSPEVTIDGVAGALALTSSVMLTVGLLACVEPARRALRISPTDALKEA